MENKNENSIMHKKKRKKRGSKAQSEVQAASETHATEAQPVNVTPSKHSSKPSTSGRQNKQKEKEKSPAESVTNVEANKSQVQANAENEKAFLSLIEKERIFPLKKKSVKFPRAKYFCRLCEYHLDKPEDCRRHVLESRHMRKKEVMTSENILFVVPPPRNGQVARLTSMIQEIYSQKGLSPQELEQRQQIVQKVEAFVRKGLPDICLRLYGSSLTGFGLKEADVNMDLYIAGGDIQPKTLKDFAVFLSTNGGELVDNVVTDFSAKVPSVRFKDQETGVACKVVISCTSSVLTSHLLRAFALLDPRTTRLCVAFRYWAKICRFDRQDEGTLPPYAFDLMTIYFLQRTSPPVVPILSENLPKADYSYLRNKEGYNWTDYIIKNMKNWQSANQEPDGALWLLLLRYYCLVFNTTTSVVSIGNSIDKTEKKWYYSKKLAVEDPYLPRRNIARTVGNTRVYEYMQDSLRKAYHYFSLPRREGGESMIPENLLQELAQQRMEIISRCDNEETKSLLEVSEHITTSISSRSSLEKGCNKDLRSVGASPTSEHLDDSNNSAMPSTPGDHYVSATEDSSSSSVIDQNDFLLAHSHQDACSVDTPGDLVDDSLSDCIGSLPSTPASSSPAKLNKFNNGLCCSLKGENGSCLPDLDNLSPEGCHSTLSRMDSPPSSDSMQVAFGCAFSIIQISCSESNSEALSSVLYGLRPKPHSFDESKDGKCSSHPLCLLLVQLDKEDCSYEFSSKTLMIGQGPAVICGYCEKEGHLKSACPEDKLPSLDPLPPLTPSYIDLLNRTLECVPGDFELSQKHYAERQNVLDDLEMHIRQTYPDACLRLFGSSCNGFGFRSSDLDICVTFSNKLPEDLDFASIIETLAKMLKNHPHIINVVSIPTAKVPIVKFRHRKINLEGDISLYNTLAQHNTRLLHCYSCIDPRVRILGYAAKVFAKVCEIGDASKGSLSSYAYILMVIHFLQQIRPPVLPVLQELFTSEKKPEKIVDGCNAWFFSDLENIHKVWKDFGKNDMSPAQLWVAFFRYYTEEFNYKSQVITIRQKEILTRFEKLWNGSCVAIEDPFDLNHNLGAGLTRRMNNYIFSVLHHGRKMYGTPVEPNMWMQMGYRTAADYFFDQELLTSEAPPNDRGCRICGKIGHIAKECPIVLNRKARQERERQKKQANNRNENSNDNSPSERRNVLRCFNCGEEGHMIRDCPVVDKSRNAKDTANQMLQPAWLQGVPMVFGAPDIRPPLSFARANSTMERRGGLGVGRGEHYSKPDSHYQEGHNHTGGSGATHGQKPGQLGPVRPSPDGFVYNCVTMPDGQQVLVPRQPASLVFPPMQHPGIQSVPEMLKKIMQQPQSAFQQQQWQLQQQMQQQYHRQQQVHIRQEMGSVPGRTVIQSPHNPNISVTIPNDRYRAGPMGNHPLQKGQHH